MEKTIRLSRKELLEEHVSWSDESSTIFRLLKKKGVPMEGNLRPTPLVGYCFYFNPETQDLIFEYNEEDA